MLGCGDSVRPYLQSYREVEFKRQMVLNARDTRDAFSRNAQGLAFLVVLDEAEKVHGAVLDDDVFGAQLRPRLGGKVLQQPRSDGTVICADVWRGLGTCQD